MKTGLKYKRKKKISKEDLKALYKDNGWTLYLADLNSLQNAVANSLYVLSAWDESQLIGLIRVVGDGYSIVYIQDILILKAYQRQGIGTILINDVLNKYKHVRQKILLTDDQPSNISFYEKLGFKNSTDINCIAYVKHNI